MIEMLTPDQKRHARSDRGTINDRDVEISGTSKRAMNGIRQAEKAEKQALEIAKYTAT